MSGGSKILFFGRFFINGPQARILFIIRALFDQTVGKFTKKAAHSLNKVPHCSNLSTGTENVWSLIVAKIWVSKNKPKSFLAFKFFVFPPVTNLTEKDESIVIFEFHQKISLQPAHLG